MMMCDGSCSLQNIFLNSSANGRLVKINRTHRPTYTHEHIHVFQTFVLTRSLTLVHSLRPSQLCRVFLAGASVHCVHCARVNVVVHARQCIGIYFGTPPPMVSFSFWIRLMSGGSVCVRHLCVTCLMWFQIRNINLLFLIF